MRVPSLLLHTSLLWLVLGFWHLQTGESSAPTIDHQRQRAPSDLSRLPLAAQSNISAVLGRDDPNYAVRVRDGRAQVENAQQTFSADFTADGVDVRAGVAHLRMALSGYGHGTALKTVEASILTWVPIGSNTDTGQLPNGM